MHKSSQILNPLTITLKGVQLIEASAGTGKTFTISLLYLRLLLGLNQNVTYNNPLSVEEILVVTFTELATNELRRRIFSDIHQLRLACMHGKSNNLIFTKLLNDIPNFSNAVSQLLMAERQIDKAAIFTIHGFCQRMLNFNAFESGMLFEYKFIENEEQLIKQAVADFWRRYCYTLRQDLADIIAVEWKSPDDLLKTLRPWLYGTLPIIKKNIKTDKNISSLHKKNCARILKIKKQWQTFYYDIHNIILNSGINKHIYNKKNLLNWINKITKWSESETFNYKLPKELAYFSQQNILKKSILGEAPIHFLFKKIDIFFSKPLSLREIVISQALLDIRKTIQNEKKTRALLGFDDLLDKLDYALQQPNGLLLANSIRSSFPVALIDEFQDTNSQQYRIFHSLYMNRSKETLLLVGDPKQSIYSFRGADIFTYLRASKDVNTHYNIDTNWRSSPGMVKSINKLFSRVKMPFIFPTIPFLIIKSAESNKNLKLILNNKQQPALRFWLQPGDNITVSNYQEFMAKQCAFDIKRWLLASQKGQAKFINKNNTEDKMKASDITVLIRNHKEAELMQDALHSISISSIYISHHNSVYSTIEARELLWILQAIESPEQNNLLKRALATSIFGVNANTLDTLNNNEVKLDQLFKKFIIWQNIWYKRGILSMLRNLIMDNQLAANILASENGNRKLTNLMHLSELLQEESRIFHNPYSLINFLTQRINQRVNSCSIKEQIRIDSDASLVRITTIHKSKGLQYPFIWLPFISDFKESTTGFYHDRNDFSPILDVYCHPQSVKFSEEERLSEDLRILYVALTRSIYHCSIGIAPLIKGMHKKRDYTDLHKSALGYLVQSGKKATAAKLVQHLQSLIDSYIEVNFHKLEVYENYQDIQHFSNEILHNNITRKFIDNWRVTSYTKLVNKNSTQFVELIPHFDIDATVDFTNDTNMNFTVHNFPKGATAGTFLHYLFENIDFAKLPNNIWLQDQLKLNGYSIEWLPIIKKWIKNVLYTPLNVDGLTLSQINTNKRIVEMKFCFPINNLLNPINLDCLLRKHDYLSQRSPILKFEELKGMLQGFIDLVFYWKNKYYLLDYKSNWLGDNYLDYTKKTIEESMINHRYDLQYQFYTLALHRYLKHRLHRYDYKRDFGGIFYLFLRGMNDKLPQNGVFTTRLSEIFIKELDMLLGNTRQI